MSALGYYTRDGQPTDFEGFSAGLEKNKIVARTIVGQIDVSTVFLGIDHNWSGVGAPILFETMLFGQPYGFSQRRYETETQAVAGHAEAVTALQEGRRLDWFEVES